MLTVLYLLTHMIILFTKYLSYPLRFLSGEDAFFLQTEQQELRQPVQDLRFSLLFGHTMHLLFMKCTVCIDSETDECQVIFAGVADFARCVLFVPEKRKSTCRFQQMLVWKCGSGK